MKNYRIDDEESGMGWENVLKFLRILAAGFGMVVIGIGVSGAARIISLILRKLKEPEGVGEVVATWAEAMGGEALDVTINGAAYPGATILAIVVVGGALLVAGWLSLGLIAVGGKLLSWTLSEREAVKRILEHAFGPRGKPYTPASELTPGQQLQRPDPEADRRPVY